MISQGPVHLIDPPMTSPSSFNMADPTFEASPETVATYLASAPSNRAAQALNNRAPKAGSAIIDAMHTLGLGNAVGPVCAAAVLDYGSASVDSLKALLPHVTVEALIAYMRVEETNLQIFMGIFPAAYIALGREDLGRALLDALEDRFPRDACVNLATIVCTGLEGRSVEGLMNIGYTPKKLMTSIARMEEDPQGCRAWLKGCLALNRVDMDRALIEAMEGPDWAFETDDLLEAARNREHLRAVGRNTMAPSLNMSPP